MRVEALKEQARGHEQNEQWQKALDLYIKAMDRMSDEDAPDIGLLDEAIAEYQQALRASADHLPTYELLGQTFLDKNEPEAALRSLTRALDAPFEIEDELMGIYYYLGMSHEALGNKDQAVEFYDRVLSLGYQLRGRYGAPASPPGLTQVSS